MLRARYGFAGLAAVMAIAGLSASAEATYRGCGFDRYGYHPPDFRGCERTVEIIAVPAPVVRLKRVRKVKPIRRVRRAPPVRRVIAVAPPPPPPPPFEGYYAAAPIQPGCYFDNGYDMRVHRICYTGW